MESHLRKLSAQGSRVVSPSQIVVETCPMVSRQTSPRVALDLPSSVTTPLWQRNESWWDVSEPVVGVEEAVTA